MGGSSSTRERRAGAAAAAVPFGGVLSRQLLRGLGVDDRMVRREVCAQRWRVHGRQTVALHTGDLDATALHWRAVWEVGIGIAALDGVSALRVAGLTGFRDDAVHVSVRHTASVDRVPGVETHQLIRRLDDELVPVGVPRTVPAVAAVRAARWAVSDRQAALLLVMPVQQRLCTGTQLLDATRRTTGRTRRRFIRLVARDIADGAQSLGELDFAAMCRRHGLPDPTRQAVRRGPRGRVHLDAAWESHGVVVEVDGAGHRFGLAVTDDNLRQNEVVLGREVVLRIDLVGLRLAEGRFMRQLRTALARSRYSATGSW